ncbi:MAG: universal stress protein [Weeksellaceae bacterium]
MKLIKNILVGVDFRESTENILKNAELFAEKFNSKITLVHVLPDDIENEKVGHLVKKAAEDELEKLNKQLQEKGLETNAPILKFGEYSEAITFTVDEIGANAVMIGAGEKLQKDTFKLGTTASKVMKKSHKPVFVVKSNQNLENTKNILCPVDFSEESSNALSNAVAIARLFDAKLIVLSVYNYFMNTSATRIDPAEVNAQRKLEQELELTRFLEKQNLVNVDYTTEVTGGDPATEILKAIERHDIDLLLMGTTGKSGISRILMGSVAEKVTREMPCSFITSKKEHLLDFDLKEKDLESYYQAAETLYEKGFYQQAISMYGSALDLNFSHVPSLKGLSKSHKALGDEAMSKKYESMIKNVLEQFQNFKIEEEVRKNMHS